MAALRVGLLDAAAVAETPPLVEAYTERCRALQLSPFPSVLVFLRLRLPSLRPEPHRARHPDADRLETFGDADLYALCDFLLSETARPVFAHWDTCDLTQCAIGSPGAVILARVFRLPYCRVRVLVLENQRIGLEGSEALSAAIEAGASLERVSLKLNFLRDGGGEPFLAMLAAQAEGGGAGAACRLAELDLSNNLLSFDTCSRLQLVKPAQLSLVLKGNRVLDEVLNATSHAIGTVLVIIGAVFLALDVAELPEANAVHGVVVWRSTYVTSTTIYIISLFILYLSSTLYHSVFALGDAVVYVFAVFDHCAIYVLIAGSYTPFLLILFPDVPLYSVWLLGFMWGTAGLGVALYLNYHGPYKVSMQVASYIAMGWACLLCGLDIVRRMIARPVGLAMLLGGGVAYTGGVPFFVRDKRTCGVPDHTIWHCFVMLGSGLHYGAIKDYIVPWPYNGTAYSTAG